MATDVFDLYAKLGLDSSEYEKGLSSAEKQGSGFGKGLASAAKTGVSKPIIKTALRCYPIFSTP